MTKITIDREVVEQARVALEYHTEQTRPIQNTIAAIAALREALSQPEQVAGEPVAAEVIVRRTNGPWQRYNIYNSVSAAEDTKKRVDGDGIEVRVVPLYAAPQPLDKLTALSAREVQNAKT